MQTGVSNVAAKQSQLEALIGPVVESLGYTLWGLEFRSQGKQSMLRIYIDALEQDQGIQLEDCEKVSRQVSGVLDVEDPITEEYTLEVSSPGVDRLLFTLEQYAAWAGAEVNLRLRVPFEGRRKFRGIVRGIEDQDVILVVDDHELLLPIESIDKAQVIPKFD
nr:ribosome maturation factor RimP [Endozoicomonas sp. OPT23]